MNKFIIRIAFFCVIVGRFLRRLSPTNLMNSQMKEFIIETKIIDAKEIAERNIRTPEQDFEIQKELEAQ